MKKSRFSDSQIMWEDCPVSDIRFLETAVLAI